MKDLAHENVRLKYLVADLSLEKQTLKDVAAGNCRRVPKSSSGKQFIGTPEVITRCGHRVVFADVDPAYNTLNAKSVRAKLTTNTAAMLPVHLYACGMDALRGCYRA